MTTFIWFEFYLIPWWEKLLNRENISFKFLYSLYLYSGMGSGMDDTACDGLF